MDKQPIVLDTNILLLAVRNSPIWQAIKADYQIEFQDTFISIVSKAEILSLAEQFKWGESKKARLSSMLTALTVISVDSQQIIDAYVNLDLYSQMKLEGVSYPMGFTAKNMGKNDLWIAATTNAIDATLLSTDKDFDHLKDVFIKFEWIKIND